LTRASWHRWIALFFSGASNGGKGEIVGSRLRNLLVGNVVLIAGVAGLFLPVALFDGGSSTIGCGNALTVNQSEARAANDATVGNPPPAGQVAPRPDYAAECETAISGRRHWAIPLVIVGAAGILVGVLFGGRRRPSPGRT
jgi:hypothetical protein